MESAAIRQAIACQAATPPEISFAANEPASRSPDPHSVAQQIGGPFTDIEAPTAAAVALKDQALTVPQRP